MSRLPVDEVLPDLLARLTEGPSAVLRAATGAGKTTRVPPFLRDSGLVGDDVVLMLEPRRVAARAAARRMAEERGSPLGAEIGYQVRWDRRAGRDTRIFVVTEGILVRMLQEDPFLEETFPGRVGAIIFDEFHERRLDTDLSLGMARRVQSEARPDLRIVVMSATLPASRLAEILEVGAVVESEGREYPVAISYLPRPDDRPDEDVVAEAVKGEMARERGHGLVFLPGVGEIRRTGARLRRWAQQESVELCELFGDLAPEAQDAVLRPSAKTKVVLATNVAETSVTIDGIAWVVDSGWVRRLRHDDAVGLDRLERVPISRASADQRAGRAGRQGPGRCLRLWSEREHRTRDEFDPPEIARVDLSGTVLQLRCWGESELTDFPWVDPPAPEALSRAESLLQRLGALDETGPTELGRKLRGLPVSPRLARLLWEGARRGETRRAALAAALLSERDPFRGQPRRTTPSGTDSDLLDRVHALSTFARTEDDSGVHGPAARQVLRVSRQLEKEVARLAVEPMEAEEREVPTTEKDRDVAILQAALAAYPDRLARRREKASPRAVMVGGKGVRLVEESAVRETELFLCLDIDASRRGRSSEPRVRMASAVDPQWLPAALLTEGVEVEFEEQSERVVARHRVRWEDLVIAESVTSASDPTEVTRVLARAAARSPRQALALGDQEVVELMARIACLKDWMPSVELPDVDEEFWAERIPLYVPGCRSFADLRRRPLVPILLAELGLGARQALDRHAPERVRVPGGAWLRLSYERGRPPILAARIQQLFGLEETPRVGDGSVAVLVHLLAPNGRPQQITDDLGSFWSRTYPVVRKELRARYPKHAWPEDPRAAATGDG